MSIKAVPNQNCIQKALASTFAASATSCTLSEDISALLSTVSTDNPGVFVVDRIDSNGTATPTKREYCTFTGVSTTTLSGITRNADSSGSDQEHSTGAVVEFVMDALWGQSVVDTFDVEHDADGTHDTTKVVDLTTAQTLTNKTLTSPVINTGLSGTAKATGAEVTTGTEDAKFVTPKAIGDAGVNTRLKSKVLNITRDMTAASGAVAYTGVGFQPSAMWVYAVISGSTNQFSMGFCDSALDELFMLQDSAGNIYPLTNKLLKVESSGGNAQECVVNSFDSDGFTLGWTKTNSPTGTVTVMCLLFR